EHHGRSRSGAGDPAGPPACPRAGGAGSPAASRARPQGAAFAGVLLGHHPVRHLGSAALPLAGGVPVHGGVPGAHVLDRALPRAVVHGRVPALRQAPSHGPGHAHSASAHAYLLRLPLRARAAGAGARAGPPRGAAAPPARRVHRQLERGMDVGRALPVVRRVRGAAARHPRAAPPGGRRERAGRAAAPAGQRGPLPVV
ncbi:MAG: hypothetical protein AVDCRST_MAG89-3958, partial [uncultured Gemmatimonadetes bacterium]